MTCSKDHRYWDLFRKLPSDQGNDRHICAGCAYELGESAGICRLRTIEADLENLPESQAGSVRHKSAFAAFAVGYETGIFESYQKDNHAN